ncbi:hypothetical protein BpHYR1_048491 [Brachionus plicatilis]|uniref:Uncharacterized protein n=1 Tax=Brachionus plicatilis TaxID=10195 RepID=A0A3M7QUI6_BRAPC|nr:hypothetical protein BpHYR1_048491 [Brachionus plicatilis]
MYQDYVGIGVKRRTSPQNHIRFCNVVSTNLKGCPLKLPIPVYPAVPVELCTKLYPKVHNLY